MEAVEHEIIAHPARDTPGSSGEEGWESQAIELSEFINYKYE
ncbi:hypothetical protein [Brevibacillus brevis]|uniref:Uncharacterized protein n=1 Tax=Brevibacillus brevis TaxID=1393 RepID=A0ABY9T6C4_BREBE|nr:hypothetical protein [Brevibacillus brevis]WNC15645.1 hypothetical protein RGB73_04710 [Brevibacillus brevis]